MRLDPWAHAHYNLALVLERLGGQTAEIARHYRRALWIDGSSVAAHMNLGLLLFRSGNWSEGLAHLRRAVDIDPSSVRARYNLGRMLVVADQPQEGFAHLRRAIAINPWFFRARRDLAWFLATHPDAQIRDPNAAVEAAERACKMTRDRDGGVLDTLGAAYASGGQYGKAIEAAGKALAVAKRLGADELAGQIEERLHLYENECPYYENPRVQLDRIMAEEKKRQAGDRRPEAGGDPNSQSGLPRGARNDMIRNPKLENAGLEVQDGAEALVAE